MARCTASSPSLRNRSTTRVNIRISTKDLEAIQKRAVEEGLPYQTLTPAGPGSAPC